MATELYPSDGGTFGLSIIKSLAPGLLGAAKGKRETDIKESYSGKLGKYFPAS